MILQKFFTVLASVLSGSTSDTNQSETLARKVDELERKIDEMSMVTTGETCGANTALARPILDTCDPCACHSNWFLSITPLLWHVKVGGTAFAYSDSAPDLSLPISGRIKQVDFEWDLGFEATLGYQFNYGGWDMLLQYCSYDTHASESTSVRGDNALIPLKGYEAITEQDGKFVFCQEAKSQFSLNYQSAQWQLGRHFYVEEHLSLRPHIGIAGYVLQLDQIARYYGGQPALENLGLQRNFVQIRDVSHYWGVGPQMGIDTKWHLGKYICIVSDMSSTIAYGRFSVDHGEKYSLGLPNHGVHLQENFHFFTPNCTMKFGLEYNTYINEDRNHLRLSVLYSLSYFLRVNQMQQVQYPIPNTSLAKFQSQSNDVGLHGLQMHFRLDF